MNVADVRPFRLVPAARGVRFDTDALVRLGASMVRASPDRTFSQVPVGYTYLGQFIDHDVTMPSAPLRTARHHGDPSDDPALLAAVSPALDLDCVYGVGLGDSRARYTPHGEFLLGEVYFDQLDRDGRRPTEPLPLPRDPYDLPRSRIGQQTRTAIPDQRNDENLIVAQLHLLMMRAHNALMRGRAVHLGGSRAEAFSRARAQLTRAYQRVVRDDFLAKICHPAAYDFVIRNRAGRNDYIGLLDPAGHDRIALPLEFAGAAFRFGHCLVRRSYTLNRCALSSLSTGLAPDSVGLPDLFRYTARGGLGGLPGLPRTLKLDWARFFARDGEPRPALAHDFSPAIVDVLGRLPLREFNLAARNLLRQNALDLPSGQHLARAIPDQLREELQVELLSARQLASCMSALADAEDVAVFSHSTPLWFYLLAEARICSEGRCLGPLGSYIVAESLRAAMVMSKYSIYGGDGRRLRYRPGNSFLRGVIPEERQSGEGKFRMRDLINFVECEEARDGS